jgi:hypothetical protein
MKRLVALLLLTLFSIETQAQHRAGGQNIQRVQAAKVGYITERLDLTPEQAERFWPVYRRYQAEQRALRRPAVAAAREHIRASTEKSEAQLRQSIDDNLKMQEERLALKRKYKDEFLRVISAQQLMELYKAEQDFNRLLLQRVRAAQGKGQRKKVYTTPGD